MSNKVGSQLLSLLKKKDAYSEVVADSNSSSLKDDRKTPTIDSNASLSIVNNEISSKTSSMEDMPRLNAENGPISSGQSKALSDPSIALGRKLDISKVFRLSRENTSESIESSTTSIKDADRLADAIESAAKTSQPSEAIKDDPTRINAATDRLTSSNASSPRRYDKSELLGVLKGMNLKPYQQLHQPLRVLAPLYGQIIWNRHQNLINKNESVKDHKNSYNSSNEMSAEVQRFLYRSKKKAKEGSTITHQQTVTNKSDWDQIIDEERLVYPSTNTVTPGDDENSKKSSWIRGEKVVNNPSTYEDSNHTKESHSLTFEEQKRLFEEERSRYLQSARKVRMESNDLMASNQSTDDPFSIHDSKPLAYGSYHHESDNLMKELQNDTEQKNISNPLKKTEELSLDDFLSSLNILNHPSEDLFPSGSASNTSRFESLFQSPTSFREHPRECSASKISGSMMNESQSIDPMNLNDTNPFKSNALLSILHPTASNPSNYDYLLPHEAAQQGNAISSTWMTPSSSSLGLDGVPDYSSLSNSHLRSESLGTGLQFDVDLGMNLNNIFVPTTYNSQLYTSIPTETSNNLWAPELILSDTSRTGIPVSNDSYQGNYLSANLSAHSLSEMTNYPKNEDVLSKLGFQASETKDRPSLASSETSKADPSPFSSPAGKASNVETSGSKRAPTGPNMSVQTRMQLQKLKSTLKVGVASTLSKEKQSDATTKPTTTTANAPSTAVGQSSTSAAGIQSTADQPSANAGPAKKSKPRKIPLSELFK